MSADLTPEKYAGHTQTPRDCEAHGQLARSCDYCERDREIARLTATLAAVERRAMGYAKEIDSLTVDLADVKREGAGWMIAAAARSKEIAERDATIDSLRESLSLSIDQSERLLPMCSAGVMSPDDYRRDRDAIKARRSALATPAGEGAK